MQCIAVLLCSENPKIYDQPHILQWSRLDNVKAYDQVEMTFNSYRKLWRIIIFAYFSAYDGKIWWSMQFWKKNGCNGPMVGKDDHRNYARIRWLSRLAVVKYLCIAMCAPRKQFSGNLWIWKIGADVPAMCFCWLSINANYEYTGPSNILTGLCISGRELPARMNPI